VQSLPYTRRGVVTPAQALLAVPRQTHIEIEAMVSNRESASSIGQMRIKIDTFIYRYGLIHGIPDCLQTRSPDRPADKSTDGGVGAENASTNRGQNCSIAPIGLDDADAGRRNNVNLSRHGATSIKTVPGIITTCFCH